MSATVPETHFDARFSEPDTEPVPWSEVADALTRAELYWLTTVRRDGRPHVTPLVGLWHDGAFCFCTGLGEQKRRNLGHAPEVAVTTGTNTWKEGLDVVVEGSATRVTGRQGLQELADAYREKYGEDWAFEVGDDDGFGTVDEPVPVYRVDPVKVLAFGKRPHSQTAYRF